MVQALNSNLEEAKFSIVRIPNRIITNKVLNRSDRASLFIYK